MSYYLAIVGSGDKPLYELEFGSSRQGNDGAAHFSPTMRELNPSVVHAALDVIDETQWTTPNLYLKTVDTFYSYFVSAFITMGNTRFLLLHETRNEEAIRQFFMDIWSLYTKTLLSPFYEYNTPIESTVFDAKVKALGRKYL